VLGTRSPDQLHLVMLQGAYPGDVLPKEDVRGLEVKDAAARKVGHVDDLVIDTSNRRVRLLKIGYGGLLGIGREHRLVPVDVVESIVGGVVFLTRDRAHVEAAPDWGEVSGESFMTALYRHFGCDPFWDEGYVQPDWAHVE